MKYIEHAEALLIKHGFTLAETDEVRKAIQKKLTQEMNTFRKSFLANGGTAAEWALIKITFRTKPRSFLLNYPAVSQETLDRIPKCVNTFGHGIYNDDINMLLFTYGGSRTRILTYPL